MTELVIWTFIVGFGVGATVGILVGAALQRMGHGRKSKEEL